MRKRAQVRLRMSGAGTVQDMQLRAYADAGGTQLVLDDTLVGPTTVGVWREHPVTIQTGNLFYRVWHPGWGAWLGNLSVPFDLAQGTRLDIDATLGSPWTCTYAQSDPGGYYLLPPNPPLISGVAVEPDLVSVGSIGVTFTMTANGIFLAGGNCSVWFSLDGGTPQSVGPFNWSVTPQPEAWDLLPTSEGYLEVWIVASYGGFNVRADIWSGELPSV